MSRIATGNWDAVIVTHSGFEKIPVARATQEAFFKEHLRELALAIELKVAVDFSDFGNGFQVLMFAKQTRKGRALPLYFEILRYPIVRVYA
jgi:hypothetical protein